jgi:hypothetical protein
VVRRARRRGERRFVFQMGVFNFSTFTGANDVKS